MLSRTEIRYLKFIRDMMGYPDWRELYDNLNIGDLDKLQLLLLYKDNWNSCIFPDFNGLENPQRRDITLLSILEFYSAFVVEATIERHVFFWDVVTSVPKLRRMNPGRSIGELLKRGTPNEELQMSFSSSSNKKFGRIKDQPVNTGVIRVDFSFFFIDGGKAQISIRPDSDMEKASWISNISDFASSRHFRQLMDKGDNQNEFRDYIYSYKSE